MKIIVALFVAGMCACASGARGQETAQVVSPGVRAPGQQQVPDNVLVDVQPQVKKHVVPVYPREALDKGSEGKVWVKILVDTAGLPAQVEILKSENEYFDQASITAARQWVFSPAMKDNKPVATWITLPIKFKLADKSNGERTDHAGKEGSALAESFLQKVQMIFGGDASARGWISADAYLVDGPRFVSLNDAVFGKDRGKCFAGEKGRSTSFVKTVLSEDGATATLVMKTESGKRGAPHWHTITWARGNGGEWKVIHWHASR
jgi:TonB family protein